MPSPDKPDSDASQPMPGRPRSRFALGVGAAALVTALMTGGYALATTVGAGDGSTESSALQSRQAEVKELGASVMPFDLDRTEHVFTDLPDGGEQTVTVLDPADATQIRLIRDHLREEAAKFRAGDFGDPTAIHGADMPGLAELKDGSGRIEVAYIRLADGARLRYTTVEPILVDGIHSWFKAQTMDHGTTRSGHTG